LAARGVLVAGLFAGEAVEDLVARPSPPAMDWFASKIWLTNSVTHREIGSVNTELKILERAGLLVRLPKERGERKVYLERQESAYWQACVEWVERAHG
jgi:hypothetical protein